MPRLPQPLLVQARSISPLLPLLVRATRTLPSARNELRWLQEYALRTLAIGGHSPDRYRRLLLQLCEQRSRGVPLQYLLKSQPFGDLDILCRQEVLIPRPETEAYTSHLAKIIRSNDLFDTTVGLKVLDLCTGTGCIPLLLFSLLARNYPQIEILGIDISETALKLARKNLRHNVAQAHLGANALHRVLFMKADLLSNNFCSGRQSVYDKNWDIVISNPPYISETDFNKSTSRSVRNWEPKLALVPPEYKMRHANCSRQEDIFYPIILDTALSSRAKVVLMEVSDTTQALRVAQIALDRGFWRSVEIWRDWPSHMDEDAGTIREVVVGEHVVTFKGSGQGRAVVCKI